MRLLQIASWKAVDTRSSVSFTLRLHATVPMTCCNRRVNRERTPLKKWRWEEAPAAQLRSTGKPPDDAAIVAVAFVMINYFGELVTNVPKLIFMDLLFGELANPRLQQQGKGGTQRCARHSRTRRIPPQLPSHCLCFFCPAVSPHAATSTQSGFNTR